MRLTEIKGAIAVVALIAMTAGPALASDNHGIVAPETAAALKARVETEGYEVRRVQTEHGSYEVYAVKDGKRYEIYVDSNMNILRVKTKN